MLYKIKLQHDRWYQSSELIYTQKFEKAGMSIFGDAKSYYVKNSSVNSVIVYIHMNILKMNFFLFPFTKKTILGYAQLLMLEVF